MKPLFRSAAACVSHGGVLLDIGAGIRPQKIVRADSHVCVEPFAPYADHLEAIGYTVKRCRARDALNASETVDHIVMLDVIEHMERQDGEAVLRLAQEKARQVVVFTPLGFVAQEGDAWGMGGDDWQRHRSGWLPEDFPGWTVLVDPSFHASKKAGAFFAIWKC